MDPNYPPGPPQQPGYPQATTFTTNEPASDCPDNGTTGLWQNLAATGDKIQCQTGQVAVIAQTPSQTHTDDEIMFNGVQGQTFPATFQSIVYVDIGQANTACAGVLVRSDSAGYARFGFYMCGGANPNTGVRGFDEVIPYDASGKPINTQIVTQNLPEGTKTRYNLTVHANGTTIAFKLDSHLVATKADVHPIANDYIALAVDTGQDTAVGTDITYFSDFAFTPLS
jgi:hypothetical protein